MSRNTIPGAIVARELGENTGWELWTAAVNGQEPPVRLPQCTFEDVVTEARKGNRMCPRPRRWHELFLGMSLWAQTGAGLPAPPPNGQIWRTSPALAKRMMFRDHLEWAQANGCLPQVMQFMLAMPEEHWYHLGD
jgi:hypothetical protein